jgi:hypothetical protein
MNQRTHLEERHLYLHLTYIIVFSLLAIALLLPFVLQVSLITTPNYNEGWNAFFALKAMRMENLYSSPGTLVQNNYPPLSFYIVGLIGTLIGDQVIAGRLVSLASMLIVSFNIFLSVFLMTRDRFASVLSGLLYLAIMGAFFRVGNFVARYAAGINKVRDCTAGFRAIRSSLLRKVDLKGLRVQGYAFQVALLHEAVVNGGRVREIPVEFIDRTVGESKLAFSDILEFVINA